MTKVLLFDDGKLPNLALMKLSTFYKHQGFQVVLEHIDNPSGQKADMVLCSVLFTWNKQKAEKLRKLYSNIVFGGTGWDLSIKLPPEVESCKPDYDLYGVGHIYPRIKGIMTREARERKAQEIVYAGIGFTSRGCVRKCGFCVVPRKEGRLHQDAPIKDLINPRSNVIILLDNNLTADPDCIEKLKEIKERNLVVDITQGIDVRLMTPEIAQALSEVTHLRSLHYAWDLMPYEHQVMNGIQTLSKVVNKRRHMCFMLVGYNTTFEEDMYRYRRLREIGVDPYVMIYNKKSTYQLHHFARWVNGRFYKKCNFDEYSPWIKARQEGELLFNYS